MSRYTVNAKHPLHSLKHHRLVQLLINRALALNNPPPLINPNQEQEIPHQEQEIPQPEQEIPQPEQEIPQPEQEIPQLEQEIPHQEEEIP